MNFFATFASGQNKTRQVPGHLFYTSGVLYNTFFLSFPTRLNAEAKFHRAIFRNRLTVTGVGQVIDIGNATGKVFKHFLQFIH